MRCVLFPSLDLTITTAMNYKKSSSHCFFCQLFVQSFLISVARANDAVSHLSNVTPSFSYSKFHFKNCHFKYWSFDVEIYIEPLSFFFCRQPLDAQSAGVLLGRRLHDGRPQSTQSKETQRTLHERTRWTRLCHESHRPLCLLRYVIFVFFCPTRRIE